MTEIGKRFYLISATLTMGWLLVLILMGTLVRHTNATHACGESWLGCNGAFVPLGESIRAWLDWGHRLSTLFVALFLLITVGVAWHYMAKNAIVRRLTLACLGLLIVQSLLGAVALWWEWLPTFTLLHLGLALMMLSTLVAALTHLMIATLPQVFPPPQASFANAMHSTTLMIFMVLMTGAMIVGEDASYACDFPLCGYTGGSLTEVATIHLVHRGSVGLLGIVLGVLMWRTHTEYPADSRLKQGVRLLMGLYGLQVLLGAAFALDGGHLAPYLAALHVVLAGCNWAVSIALSIIIHKQAQHTLAIDKSTSYMEQEWLL